jgi:hypothetical protein
MKSIGYEAYLEGMKQRANLTGVIKSFGPKDVLDSAILKSLDVKTLLHPGECYSDIHNQADWPHEKLPLLEPLNELPKEYTAMRFYSRDTFTEPEVAKKLIEEARKEMPVVLMFLGEAVDDHKEFPGLKADVNVVCRAVNALKTMSRAICNAKKFVCTYGGLSYLGPLYGVSTIAVSNIPEKCGGRHFAQEKRMLEAVDGNYRKFVLTARREK